MINMPVSVDMLCHRYGNSLAKVDAALIGQAANVLKNNGMYAFFLYVNYKSKDGGNLINNEAINLLQNKKIRLAQEARISGYDIAESLSADIDNLFLAQDIIGRMLTYARYYAKANK